MNRHEVAKTPRVMKIIAGGVEMTFTPATIERVWKEWEAENPGKRAARDMSQKEFADRCMAALKASARPVQSGTT